VNCDHRYCISLRDALFRFELFHDALFHFPPLHRELFSASLTPVQRIPTLSIHTRDALTCINTGEPEHRQSVFQRTKFRIQEPAMNPLPVLFASLVGACLASSSLAAPAPPPSVPDGQRVFAQRCSSCHTVPRLMTILKKHPADGREAYLRQVLERHYPPPPEERAALIAWLAKQ